MKTLALIGRRPGVSRDEFRAHYEAVHAPLAVPVMSGLQRYVRHHVREELFGAASFDVVTTFTYRDEAAFRGVVGRLASPDGDLVLRDELSFMDKPRNRFFAVREASEEGARSPDAPLRAIALVRRPPGSDVPGFAAEFAARSLPALRDAVRGPRWILHHEALPVLGSTPAFDLATQLHAEGDAGLAAWGWTLLHQGARAVIVEVSEHETQLPPGGVP